MKHLIMFFLLLSICTVSSVVTVASETNMTSAEFIDKSLQTPHATKYPIVHNRNLDDFGTAVIGAGYAERKTIGNLDKSVTVANIGTIRSTEKMFRKGNVVVTITWREGESAEKVKEYFNKYVATTYSAGSPPTNSTYGIGDVILSWQNLDQITNRVLFVAFFNNVAIECHFSSEGGNIKSETESFLKRLDAWTKKGTSSPKNE